MVNEICCTLHHVPNNKVCKTAWTKHREKVGFPTFFLLGADRGVSRPKLHKTAYTFDPWPLVGRTAPRNPGLDRQNGPLTRLFWWLTPPSWTLAGTRSILGAFSWHPVVVENTPQVHNVVVCTLCSCYPWPVLGLPPAWYKSAAYRSRVVIDPRSVLAEFGTKLADNVECRVWDSSSEVRYLVLPERPQGTQNLDEEQLAALVDRDAMIGISRVAVP